MMDYDGAGPAALTANQSINMSPNWSPDSRSLAFTSLHATAIPYLYRIFPFERRPVQLLAGYLGINSLAGLESRRPHASRSPVQGRQSRDLRPHAGNGALRRLTDASPASTPSRRGRRQGARSRSSPTARGPRRST